ncbi:MAG: hypothetical protein ACI857_000558 [Arenicella sp.]|jgi:hypothetical protein
MKLTLHTKLPLGELKISHKTIMTSVGSCFADNIAASLQNDGFNIEGNPLGILYDPISIRNAVKVEFDRSPASGVSFVKSAGLVDLNFHSSITAATEEELAEEILSRKMKFWAGVQKGNIIFVTFGTAWVYKHIKSNTYVANCHKLPAEDFVKELLDGQDEYIKWMSELSAWQRVNPKIKVVFTVSPVRHSKNGLHENNVSKGILHLLVDKLVKKFDFVHYFPAYEIVLDELRDYRYFKEDLVHPSQLAVDYVYEKFEESYFSKKTKEASNVKRKLVQAQGHKFMNPTKQQIDFHEKLIESLEQQFQNLIK